MTALEMHHSTVHQQLPPHLDGSLGQAYRMVDGSFQIGSFEYMQEPEGSLIISAGDMAKFIITIKDSWVSSSRD